MTTTDHLQKIPDYFLDLNDIKRKYIQTNQRYPNFCQTHFTAGDDQQFQYYRDYSNDKNKKIRLPLIDNWKIDNIDCKLYHNLSKKYVYSTFKYLFDKFKKAIFVKIKDNQLKVFLPFSNANYINEWSSYIKQDPSRWNTLNDFLKYSSSLQGFNIEDKHINSFVETWYGNNCLVRPEYPIGEGDSGVGGVKDMLIELCKNRELPDIEFFINKRDFPLLKKNLSEPYHSLFNNKNLPLLSHSYDKYYPILSMVTSEEYADIAIPTLEDWARISNIDDGKFFIPPRSYKHDFSKPFSERKPTAVFRGASTGEGTTIDTNTRLKLAYLSFLNKKDDDNIPFLNCGITKWNLRPRKEYGKKFLSTIEIKSIGLDLAQPLTPEQQTDYKYIINVDGHVSAFRLSLEMNMGSVILLVESDYKLWYHNLLIPNVHYVPIKKDLSDLYDKIKWCKTNDKKCEQISINARQFYNKFLTKNGIFDYFQFLFIKLRKNMGENYYNFNTIDTHQELLENNEINNLSYTFDKKEIKISKILLDRNGVTINQIENENDKILKTTIEIPKNINKHKESLHEFFISKKCLEDVYKFIPNFIKCYKYTTESTPNNNKNILIIREWIDGITLSDWIKSPYFTIQTFSEILLQVNLALYTAQSLCGFIHNDLYPWNIIIKKYTQPVIIKYPYEEGKVVELKTTHIPFIIDYGKSSAIYNGVRYGSLRISSIQDTITFLLSSLFESLKNQNVDIKKILEYSNFISNTDFSPKKFVKIQELKPFLKTMKKYNKLSQMNKGILEQKTPLDFVKYIIRDTHCIIKERELPKFDNLKINYRELNPDDIEIIYKFKINPELISTLFINTTPEKMKKLLNNLQQFSLTTENQNLQKYKKLSILNCSELEYLDISPNVNLEELKTVDWKEYMCLTKIYICNPKITFSVFSHSTYLFYLKLILENNIKNSKVFSKKIIENFKELNKKL